MIETLEEAEAVRSWRFERFLEIGFDHGDSELLSSLPVDVYEAERLVRSGCEPGVAVRILI